jgi:deoxyhypusine synthase
MLNRSQLLSQTNVVPLVQQMERMAFSARDLARAADIYDRMLRDPDCGIILCLAGSLVSAGLKKVFVDLLENRMVDCIVSTGANIVDQDFFEGLGFRHYIAPERLKAGLDDNELRDLRIDRIYDTLIDEDQLRICDDTMQRIADDLPPRPHSSREFIREMGAYRSSAPPSAIARPASGWWRISISGARAPSSAWTAPRTSTS